MRNAETMTVNDDCTMMKVNRSRHDDEGESMIARRRWELTTARR